MIVNTDWQRIHPKQLSGQVIIVQGHPSNSDSIEIRTGNEGSDPLILKPGERETLRSKFLARGLEARADGEQRINIFY